MSLSERALLLSLSISCWNGQVVLDVDEQRHQGLDPERDSIRHQIIPKAALTGPQAAARALRKTHVRLTAPWDDNGLRLLPSNRLFEYREAIKDRQAAYDRYIDNILDHLAAQIEPQYAKYREGLRARFGSTLSLYAVPDTGMPVLNDIVDNEIRAAMTSLVQADVHTRQAQAIGQVGTTLLTLSRRYDGFADQFCDSAVKTLEQLRSLLNILYALDPSAQTALDVSASFTTNLEKYLEQV